MIQPACNRTLLARHIQTNDLMVTCCRVRGTRRSPICHIVADNAEPAGDPVGLANCHSRKAASAFLVSQSGRPEMSRPCLQPGIALRECEAWTVVVRNSRNARVFGARYRRDG